MKKVKHKITGELMEVVRDSGGVKVIVRDKNGLELSVLRKNLEEVSNAGTCGQGDGTDQEGGQTPFPQETG